MGMIDYLKGRVEFEQKVMSVLALAGGPATTLPGCVVQEDASPTPPPPGPEGGYPYYSKTSFFDSSGNVLGSSSDDGDLLFEPIDNDKYSFRATDQVHFANATLSRGESRFSPTQLSANLAFSYHYLDTKELADIVYACTSSPSFDITLAAKDQSCRYYDRGSSGYDTGPEGAVLCGSGCQYQGASMLQCDDGSALNISMDVYLGWSMCYTD